MSEEVSRQTPEESSERPQLPRGWRLWLGLLIELMIVIMVAGVLLTLYMRN